MARLLAARFENNNSDAAFLEQFGNVESSGVRWSLETFGTDRIELTVKARNKYDVYDRLNNHNGQRVALYSSWCLRPISGNIVKVEPAGANRVTYIARGPLWRHDDQLVRATFPTGQDTDERLESLLTTYVDVVSSDYSDIDATGKDAAEFQTEWPRGNYPSEIIKAYRAMSDADDNPWDYYCVDEPFNGTSLRQYKPYFKNRNGQAVKWIARTKDMQRPTMSTSIEELKSFARVWYGSFEGTVTTANAAGDVLIDAVANFTGFGVEPGDRVTNITDGSRGKVKTVDSGSQITLVGDGLNGGSDNRFDLNDEYTIERIDAWFSATASASNAPLTRHYSTSNSRMSFGQAQSTADALIDFYGQAIQQQAFVITAPYIRDVNGHRWPLWEVIAQGGGILQVPDLYPAASQIDGTLDRRTTFAITALDYDSPNNRLRVRVDSLDGRLDEQLRVAGILGGAAISRGAQF